AQPVQYPTTDIVALNAALDDLAPQRTTAIGDAVYASLQMIFPDIAIMRAVSGADTAGGIDASSERDNVKPAKPVPAPVLPGSYRPAAIILMTDGKNTAGSDPIEAARFAANLGVRVFTIGFGGEKSQGNMLPDLVPDPAALARIASMTKAQYFHAQGAQELKQVYSQLTKTLQEEPQQTEVTVFFVAAAGLLSALSGALSLLWFHRIF
ncbi:MAG TPA: VWA domain-containing protein, partial [Rhizomicrobium sp.]|nr:VWA domain-containing protein [Rhizomicrobium sp.]